MTAATPSGTPRRVLIIGINYRPELSGIGPYTADLAEHLSSQGDDVQVITGLPHYPEWRITPGTPRSLIRRESIGGVEVVRAMHFVPRRQSAVRRAAYEATFGLAASIAASRIRRPDAILGIVPALSGAVLARLAASATRTPYGLLFHDLMGPGARQSGLARGQSVARAIQLVEQWSASDAAAVGMVSRAFAPYLLSLGVSSDRLLHVPNWTRAADPALSVDATRDRFGWTRDAQIVLHAGNIGLKQNLDQVIRAARVAAHRGSPVRFVFSGSGNQIGALKDSAAGLPNVSFLGLQPDGIHNSLLRAADVLLLSESPYQVDMSLPSKLTSYFAARRPIVAAVPLAGATASEVGRSGAGILVPADDPEHLLAALERLRSDPELAGRLADAGVAYAQAHTTAEASLRGVDALVDRISARSSSTTRELAA